MRTYILALAALVALTLSGGMALAQSYMLESVNLPGRYIRHWDFKANLSSVDNGQDKKDSVFWGKPGLDGHHISFEAYNFPDHYLRHKNGRLVLEKNDGSQQFKLDATFTGTKQPDGSYIFEVDGLPGFFIRHRDYKIFIEQNDGSPQFIADASFRMQNSGPVADDPPPPPPPQKDPPPPQPENTPAPKPEPAEDHAKADVDTTVYQKKGEDDEDTNQYLYAGDTVTIVSCDDNWCKISAPYSGWVWREDLDR